MWRIIRFLDKYLPRYEVIKETKLPRTDHWAWSCTAGQYFLKGHAEQVWKINDLFDFIGGETDIQRHRVIKL